MWSAPLSLTTPTACSGTSSIVPIGTLTTGTPSCKSNADVDTAEEGNLLQRRDVPFAW